MGLLNIVRISSGQVGVKPGTVKMTTTDTLQTICAAGYLNDNGSIIAGLNLTPSDIIEALYSYNESTDSGSFTLLQVTISAGEITLVPTAASANTALAGFTSSSTGSGTNTYTFNTPGVNSDKSISVTFSQWPTHSGALDFYANPGTNSITVTFNQTCTDSAIINWQAFTRTDI